MKSLSLLENHNFKDLLSICVGKVFSNQIELSNYLGNYNRWDVDVEAGKLYIDDRAFDVEFVGTTSIKDGMWFSAELEKIIPVEYLGILKKAKLHLEQSNLSEFYFPKVKMDDVYTDHSIATIYTAFTMENLCYFKGSGETSIFMYVKGLPDSIFESIGGNQFCSRVAQVLENFDVNHKLMIKSFALNNENRYEEKDNKVIVYFSDNNEAVFEFDDSGRVSKINANLQSTQKNVRDNIEKDIQTFTVLNSAYDNFDMIQKIRFIFKDKMKDLRIVGGKREFEVVLFDDTIISCRIIEEENIQAQINGMMNFYSSTSLKNEKLVESIKKQFELFNHVTYFKIKFDENMDRTKGIYNLFIRLVKNINGLLMLPGLSLYTGEGKLLVSKDGKTQYEEYYPVAPVEFVLKTETELTEKDKARIEKNIGILKQKQIPYYDGMKNIPTEKKVQLVNKELCYKKMLFDYTAATIATTILNRNGNHEGVYDMVMENMQKKHQISERLPANLNDYFLQFKNGNYNKESLSRMSWSYEESAVTTWALGLIDKPSYSEQCDVDELNKVLYYIDDCDNFIDRCNMRSFDEILEYADMLYRLKWACEESRIKKQELNGLNERVITFQKESIMWLLGIN